MAQDQDSTDTTSAEPDNTTSLVDPRLHFRWESYQAKDRQVVHIQRIIMWFLNQRSTDLEMIPALATAWERLENRLNRMRMNPEPKPIDVASIRERDRKMLNKVTDGMSEEPVVPKVG